MPELNEQIIKEEIKKISFIVEGNEIKKAVNEKYPNFQVVALDRKYAVSNMKNFKDFSKFNKVDQRPYTLDLFDCNTYALIFKSEAIKLFGLNSVGMVVDTGGAHSFNLIVTKENEDSPLEIRLFEPQNDKFVEIGQSRSKKEHYTGTGYCLF